MTDISKWMHALGIGGQEFLLFVLILSVCVWLGGFLFLVSHVAEQKGRSGLAWGFAALFFTPLLALIALAAVPDRLGPIPVVVETPEADEVTEYKWRKP